MQTFISQHRVDHLKGVCSDQILLILQQLVNKGLYLGVVLAIQHKFTVKEDHLEVAVGVTCEIFKLLHFLD